jgi:signal transduction histidine kinase
MNQMLDDQLPNIPPHRLPFPTESDFKVNVLLVDDHPENLVALEAVLCGLGQTLVKAQSGEKALRCLLQHDFAVILLDVQMPGMDGFETARLIRQHPRSRATPIIFLTAYSDNEALKSKGYRLGAVDYLLKPIDPEILVSKVTVFVELFKKNLEVKQQAAQIVAQNIEILQAQAARQQAEAENRMKDDFLTIVSHELRTPLNAILGWSQLLLTKEFDLATRQHALETIARNAKSQAQLVEDILDVSRIMRGKLHLSLQQVNLTNLVKSTLESIQLQAQAKNIHLVTHWPPQPLIVSGDVERLQQVMQNLLSNALKFTPAGGQVEVTLEPYEGPVMSSELGSATTHYSLLPTPRSPVAQIQVKDTGIGIHPDFLPDVFESFRQADSSSTRSYGGLGLGLAIARQLVEQHGGTIWADSGGEGKGSTFTVWLPLVAVGVEESELFASSGRATPVATTHLLDNLHILVVDDHLDTLEFVKTVLEQAGAQVTTVISAQAAMDVLQNSHPDLLVTDIAMPDENGYSLIRKIRGLEQRQRLIPAIALTAYAKPEDQQKALASGFQQFAAKPIDPTALVDIVIAVAREFSLQVKN